MDAGSGREKTIITGPEDEYQGERTGVIACPACGLVQSLPRMRRGEHARCPTCHTTLERTPGTSLGAAAALSLATFVLLIPANLLPLYRVELLAGSRESIVTSGVHLFWMQGWPLPSITMLMFVLILPLLRFLLLSIVLVGLNLGWRSPHLGSAFRVAQTLGVWAMPEVMLLGIYVAYGRLTALFDLETGAGAFFMAAATIGALLTRAAINERRIWRAIMPERERPVGEAVACQACVLVLPVACTGSDCPRCGARLSRRTTSSISVTTALIAAGIIFYIPANVLPMALTLQFTDPQSYTVLEGVIELAQAGLFPLAVLVFIASFAIPLMKLIGMAWLLWSVHSGSGKALRIKTKLHHVIHEVGRWSMVDVLAIGTFVPLMQFDQLANAQAMPGMAAFLGVVIMTMFSTHSFDSRLLWDAARGEEAQSPEFVSA